RIEDGESRIEKPHRILVPRSSILDPRFDEPSLDSLGEHGSLGKLASRRFSVSPKKVKPTYDARNQSKIFPRGTARGHRGGDSIAGSREHAREPDSTGRPDGARASERRSPGRTGHRSDTGKLFWLGVFVVPAPLSHVGQEARQRGGPGRRL